MWICTEICNKSGVQEGVGGAGEILGQLALKRWLGSSQPGRG